MKKFKAFTLTEILTGTILQAGFVIVLMGAFYMLVNFQAANTKLITAREKGQRVLAYIENRIMHAGLGLWKCNSPFDIKGAFGNNFPAFDNLTLPIAVTKGDTDSANGWASPTPDKKSGVYRGNLLTVLYTLPYMGTDKVFMIDNSNAGAVKTISGDVTCRFVDVNNINITKLDEYVEDDEDNLRSYKVAASSGAPLYISDIISGTKLKLTTKFTGESIDIASGSELMTLQCERMYVHGDAETNSIFARVKLKGYSRWGNSGGVTGAEKDSEPISYENGILAIYFELDTNNNVLDCYVLASGGKDPLLDNPFPSSWPDNELTQTLKSNWSKKGYNHHEVYVSRASWKLHNIPDSFSW